MNSKMEMQERLEIQRQNENNLKIVQDKCSDVIDEKQKQLDDLR